MSNIVCQHSAEVIFFQLKDKYPVFHFLDLQVYYGTILNLIKLKINKNCQNFNCLLQFSLFYLLNDIQILVQIYQLIIQFDQAQLTQKLAAKMVSRRLYTRLFKSIKFRNGYRISDEKCVKLEFKYLQNKKWQKQAVRSTRIKKSYRTY